MKDENVMKRMMKTVLCLSVLFVMAGCREPDVPLRGFGNYATHYYEEKDPQNLETYEVTVFNPEQEFQIYRVEGHTVSRFHAVPCKDLDDAFGRNACIMLIIASKLPNMLNQTGMVRIEEAENPCVTIIDMTRDIGTIRTERSPFENEFMWDRLWIRKWVGAIEDIQQEGAHAREQILRSWTELRLPEPIPEGHAGFRQRLADVICVPECARACPAYIRAVPLFSEEDREAEKDTPLIKVERGTPEWLAIVYPYLLFPVPPDWQPLSSAENYALGNKFKVREGGNYYLIETFRGSSKGQAF